MPPGAAYWCSPGRCSLSRTRSRPRWWACSSAEPRWRRCPATCWLAHGSRATRASCSCCWGSPPLYSPRSSASCDPAPRPAPRSSQRWCWWPAPARLPAARSGSSLLASGASQPWGCAPPPASSGISAALLWAALRSPPGVTSCWASRCRRCLSSARSLTSRRSTGPSAGGYELLGASLSALFVLGTVPHLAAIYRTVTVRTALLPGK